MVDIAKEYFLNEVPSYQELHGEGSENHPAHMPVYADVDKLRVKGLRSDLLHHQLQGLQWCLAAENREVSQQSGDTRGVYETINTDYWYDTVTECMGRDKPSLPRGGILADAMGLGAKIESECIEQSRD